MEQGDQETTAASFEQRIEASKAETEQKLQNFFSELPKMRMDSVFQNLDSFNQSFRMEDPKTSQERMTRLAEGLITYKSGDEWAEGEEWKFTLTEEREFRRHIAELGYVPWDFAKIPLKEVARRTIKEVMEVGKAVGKAYVSEMSKVFRVNNRRKVRKIQLVNDVVKTKLSDNLNRGLKLKSQTDNFCQV